MSSARWPKITLITPSFNQGRFIKQTIDSVLNQNYPNLEYFVIDGGSTDETLSILKSYHHKISWISEPDHGQTDAINKGLKKSHGEIVGYLNSDDLLLPNALATVAKNFVANPGLIWLTGDYQIINQDNQLIQKFVTVYKRFLRSLSSLLVLRLANFIAQPSTFWKRNIHQKLGYLNLDLHYCMDYDWWLRLFAVKKPLIVHQQLSQFRIHSLSKGGANYQAQFNEELEVLKKHTHHRVWHMLHSLHNYLIILIYKQIK